MRFWQVFSAGKLAEWKQNSFSMPNAEEFVKFRSKDTVLEKSESASLTGEEVLDSSKGDNIE